ncbi:unnamed protein product [Ambrosiozyma monospora]|uniref:Unnamed protein product n=1 Tax=Ambrosiozyma monospora TaxID=43982 RepID=A0ACB5TTF4_AMBMO|nr:unnamed protein product [Ambrosiozyma monospora]
MFRLAVSVSKMSDDWSLATRLYKAMSKTGPICTTISVFLAVSLLLITPFVTFSAQQYCLFTALCLVFDHVLQVTYFVAVLAIDIRRLELEDLLQRSTQLDLNQSNKYHALKPLGSGSILSSVLFHSSHGEDASFKRMLGQYLLKIKLPIFSTVKQTVFALIFMLALVFKWTDGIQYHWITSLDTVRELQLADNLSLNAFKYPNFDAFSNKRGFVTELSLVFRGLTSQKRNSFIIAMSEPTIAVLKSALPSSPSDSTTTPTLKFGMGSTYRFDIFFVLEFFSFLMFVLFGASAILKTAIDEDGLRFGRIDQGPFLGHCENLCFFLSVRRFGWYGS